MQDPRITIDEFLETIREGAPFMEVYGFDIEEIGFASARMRLPASDAHLRPGGTISGPAQMALADFTLYGAIMGAIGPMPLAVTTNLTINFLNKPRPGDILAEGKLLKVGKRLVVGEVSLFSEGQEGLVSHVTGTYSVPPR